LTDARARITDLNRIEAALSGLVKMCAALEDKTVRYPIISAFNTEG